MFSAANSDLYVATRVLYSLAKEGNSHPVFARTDSRGVPIYALGLSSLITCIAFLNVANDSRKVFGYFVSLVTMFGLLTWISILVSHIAFVRARRAQNVTKDMMAYTAPLGLFGTYLALIFCILIAIFSNYGVFVHTKTNKFDYRTFITGYLGIPLYLMLILGYKVVMRSQRRRAHEVDLFGGKDEIDREEALFVEEKERRRARKPGSWFYRTFVAWLF